MVLDVVTREASTRSRLWQIDALRGAAIVLMVGDHLALVAGDDAMTYRVTLGRLAMPIFFVLAGHLAGRLSWRHAAVGGIGLALPLVVPWIDSPNVLVLWALGCVLLWAARRVGVHPLWLVIVAATVAANGWGIRVGTSYEFLSLWALMAAGALVPRSALIALGSHLPGWLAVIGRRPVTWYVGHLLVLAGVVVGASVLDGA